MGSNYPLAQDLKLKVSTENLLLFLLSKHKFFPKLVLAGWLLNQKLKVPSFLYKLNLLFELYKL